MQHTGPLDYIQSTCKRQVLLTYKIQETRRETQIEKEKQERVCGAPLAVESNKNLTHIRSGTNH